MDPASAIGVAGAVIEFLNLSLKVAKRINEYVQASPGDVPKSLENIRTVLPLLTKSLSQLRESASIEAYDSDMRTILHGVVLGCYRLTRELDDITDKISLKHGESLGLKLKKVLQSLKNEERVLEIDRGLQAFIQVLILHRVVNKEDVRLQPSKEENYFEVKKIKLEDPVPRKELITEIHDAFSDVVTNARDIPVLVTLQGNPGSGKSQLALEYCHEAHRMGLYRAVFWLDSSSPASLRSSLENVASVIRQSKLGSSGEKLSFVNSFLTGTWYPWLLVLDDYKHKAFENETIEHLLPASGHGAVLITTQDTEWSQYGEVIKIHKFLTPNESISFRAKVTQALFNKEMSTVVDALTERFDVNSYSRDSWGRDGQPVLCVAARVGFNEAVKLLLEMGADPHLSKYHGSVLSAAASYGHEAVVRTCLEHEDTTGYSFTKGCWDMATRHCLEEQRMDIMKVFLNRRADKIDLNGSSAGEGFAKAAEKGHIEILRMLFSHNKFPTNGRIKGTALTNALKEMQLHVIEFLLGEAGFDPNEKNDFGVTALMTAMDNYVRRTPPGQSSVYINPEERKDLVKMLIRAGADPNVCDSQDKRTVLHFAANNNIVSVIPLLFENGANILLENKDGENALQYAARQGTERSVTVLLDAPIVEPARRIKFVTQAFFIAAREGDRELMLKALAEIDIDLREERTGKTALLIAIKRKDLPMARMLIRKGADQNLAERDGNVPILLAAEYGIAGLIKDLVKAKNSPGLEVTDRNGFTPLMLAVKARHEPTVSVLLSHGANADAVNDFGETAIDLAEDLNHKEIIALLEA